MKRSLHITMGASAMRISSFTIVATSTLVLALPASAAGSLTRTFVSSTGVDTNPCTVTQPCATFAAAYNAVAPNGIVAALDPGKYGPLTITGPVTINGNGWAAITGQAQSNAITVNAVSGTVILTGLEVDGAQAANSTGIQFNSGTTLNVRNSVIRNFTNVGLSFAPNSSTLSQLFVSNTLVSDNGNDGIIIFSVGSGTTSGVLDHVEIENNLDGIAVATNGHVVNMTISNSVSANNGFAGVDAQSSAALLSVMLQNTTVANNAVYGLQANGSGATILVTRSTITGNATGWTAQSSGVVLSYGDNNIDGNGGTI